MNIIAGLYIFLGLLTGFASVWLAIYKRYLTDTGGIVIPHQAPNHNIEMGLIIIGLAILCLALIQFIRHIRLATLQLIFGQDIVIISSILYTSARYSYEYDLQVYWLVFVLEALGLLVVINGIIQLVRRDK